jgi:crotonobetainyl-CoA:carnitine CoA-transferase CaiB-like acyl-CoA transferase
LVAAVKSPVQALAEIIAAGGLDFDAAQVALTSSDPVLPTCFLLATAGAAAIGAVGIAANEIWRERTGRRQSVAIDLKAAAAALRADRFLTVNGASPGSPWARLSGFYQTGDGRWMQFHCNFPHHRDGVLRILNCAASRDAMAAAAAQWNAPELEKTLADAGLCAAMVRPWSEWEANPQAGAVTSLPLLEIIRFADSAPEPLTSAHRPLAGVRALDLTRVLAGPVATRTLAEHGADVLRVTAAHLPALPETDIDTGHGKLATQIDLRSEAGRDRLKSLVRKADVFCQAYRPGTLASRGFSPEELAAERPGIIYVTLSAYGHRGPWRDRRGFDSLVQTASGIVHEESDGGRPRHLPAQALDYVSGYLLAFGAMNALLRRAREGGSYLVRASLAQTGRWIWDLGRSGRPALADPGSELADGLLEETDSPFGRLRHLAPVLRMSETPPYWSRPAVPLDFSRPEWPDTPSD